MDGPLTVRYATTRAELWRFYLHAWRSGLWRQHASIAAFLVLAGMLTAREAPLWAGAAAGVSIAALAIGALWAYPQLAYKPQERVLTIGPDGVSTEIGRRSGNFPWPQIVAIEQSDDGVILRNKSGNAFIVPRRAFASDAKRKAFADAARRWRQAA